MSKTTKVLFVPSDSSKSATFHFYYDRKTSERYLIGSSDESIFDPTIHTEILKISGSSGSFDVPGTRLVGTLSANGLSKVFKLGYKVAPSQGRKMTVNDSPDPIYVHTTHTIQEEFEVEGLSLKPARPSKNSNASRRVRSEPVKLRKDSAPKNDSKIDRKVPLPSSSETLESDASKGAIPKSKTSKSRSSEASKRAFDCSSFYDEIFNICKSSGMHPPTLIPNVSSFDITGDSKKYDLIPNFLSDKDFKIVETTDDIGVVMDCVVCPHDNELFEGCSLIRVGVSYIEYPKTNKKVAFSKRSLAE